MNDNFQTWLLLSRQSSKAKFENYYWLIQVSTGNDLNERIPRRLNTLGEFRYSPWKSNGKTTYGLSFDGSENLFRCRLVIANYWGHNWFPFGLIFKKDIIAGTRFTYFTLLSLWFSRTRKVYFTGAAQPCCCPMLSSKHRRICVNQYHQPNSNEKIRKTKKLSKIICIFKGHFVVKLQVNGKVHHKKSIDTIYHLYNHIQWISNNRDLCVIRQIKTAGMN